MKTNMEEVKPDLNLQLLSSRQQLLSTLRNLEAQGYPNAKSMADDQAREIRLLLDNLHIHEER